jgi:hypothetical protein
MGLLESLDADFGARRSDVQEGPFDTRAFLIKPSKQAYYDMFDIAVTMHYSVEKGWLEYGQIPAWGSSTVSPKHNWEFARSSQDIGILYYYYFLSPVHRSGRVHASTIDSKSWSKCVLPLPHED